MLKNSLLTFLLIFWVTSVTNITKAQELQGINISPIGVDLKLTNEESYNGTFTLTNNEQATFAIEFKEADIVNDQIRYSDLNWFAIENKPITIEANTTLNINFQLKVPPKIVSGLHPKLLIARLTSIDKESNINIDIPFKVNVVIKPGLNADNGIIIKEFKVNKLNIDNVIDFTVSIASAFEGNIVKPIGNFNIINPLGKIVYSTTLNESLAVITKDQTYKIEASIPNDNPSDMGEYTAQILFTDSLSNSSKFDKVKFVVVNPYYLIIGVIAVILVITGIRTLRKRS